MRFRTLLSFFCCFPCLALAVHGEKKYSTTTPVAPAEGYSHPMAVEDFFKLPSTEAYARLNPWLFSRCFGGRDPEAPAMQQPRVAQALWLAVITDGLGRKTVASDDAITLLDHLVTQKSLDAATADFFRNLWKDPALAGQPGSRRAADFLRAWLAAWNAPNMNADETRALAHAIAAGVTSLDFLTKLGPAGPPKK